MSKSAQKSPRYVISRGNHVLGRVIAHRVAIEAFEADKKEPIVDDDFVARMTASLKKLAAEQGEQHASKGDTEDCTQTEDTAVDVLLKDLVNIRDTFATYYPNNVRLQKVFGRGMRIEPSSPKLGEIASGFAAAWKKKSNQTAAVAVGITSERMEALAEKRSAAVDADTAQTAARVEGKTKTVVKLMTLRQVQRTTTQLIKLAGLTFVNQPSIVNEFKTIPLGAMAAGRKKGAAQAAPATTDLEAAVKATPGAAQATGKQVARTRKTGRGKRARTATALAAKQRAMAGSATEPRRNRKPTVKPAKAPVAASAGKGKPKPKVEVAAKAKPQKKGMVTAKVVSGQNGVAAAGRKAGRAGARG